jgi:hypothetical protein
VAGNSRVPQAPSYPPLPHCPFLPNFNGEKKLLPIPSSKKQLESSAHGCQVPLSNLIDILIEDENSQGPPTEMPMSGNVCFHFLWPSMNSTHGNGLGLDQIHTEANQKHLFLEINLSLGNEL